MFQNMGIGSCVKCLKKFKENDIVATSTTQHYCYNCATKINLVTGQINKDLFNDEFIPEVLYHIKSLTTEFSIPEKICKYAEILIIAAFENSDNLSKNKLGVAACGAGGGASRYPRPLAALRQYVPG